MKKEDKILVDLMVEKMASNIVNGGEVKSGHNGPYYDNERKGRNISHWICTFQCYYEKSKKDLYKDAIKSLAAYYYVGEDYCNSGVYHCRDKADKDFINGTIGAAWIIEGLLAAASTLEDKQLIDRAIALFKTFPFDSENGMWERIEIDGKNLGIDITYNHQLWFAASGAQILDIRYDNEIDNMIKHFLDKSMRTFWVMPNGLICHFANCYTNQTQHLKNLIKYVKHCVEIMLKKPSLEYKEIGYHLFDMYGFSLLQDRYGNHPLFSTEKYKKSLEYCTGDEYMSKLLEMKRSYDSTQLECSHVDQNVNTYAFPYNSPAFELPFILEKHGLTDNEKCNKLISLQIETTYDDRRKCFCRNTEDPLVLNARIYELVRSSWFWEISYEKSSMN